MYYLLDWIDKINWKNLSSNPNAIYLLESNQEIKKQYLTNQKMIDFKNIPKIYYNKVVKIFNFIHKI